MLRLFFILVSFSFVSDVIGQLPHVSAGKIVRYENFKSRNVPPRTVDVWLPPGYSAKKKYAVLYIQDAQMIFDSTNTWNKQEWGVDETISSLLMNNHIKDCIVVGIWSIDSRWFEFFPAKAFKLIPPAWQDSFLFDLKFTKERPTSDQYLKFIVTELKPFIDKTYPTRKEKENTFMVGSSMGALVSMYAVCEYPNIFGGAACLSTHWMGGFIEGNREGGIAFNKYMRTHLPSPANHRFYFDYGTESYDKWYEPLQQMVDSTMTAKGYDKYSWMTLKVSGATHTENDWRKRLPGAFFFLLKK